MTRVVESGSGLRSQNMYDLVVGAPWPGDYDVTVRFCGRRRHDDRRESATS